MIISIPATVSSLLWSTPNKLPDIKKDAAEIIHKVLAFGGLNDIRWLKKTYPDKTLKQIFQEKPFMVYTPSSFNFATNIVLHLGQNAPDKSRYVKAVY